MSGVTADTQLHLKETSNHRSSPNDEAVVVGLYGIPGSGKTYLLNQLKEELGNMLFAFYEGSQIDSTVVPRGLDVF